MKKISILGIALFAALFCGCSDEVEEIGTVPAGQNTLTASIDGIQSRTSIDMDGSGVLWSKSDEIGVYTSKGNLVKYALKLGENTKTAIFSNAQNLEEGETPLFAVYPYQYTEGNAVVVQDNYGRIQMKLPQTMDYTTCSNGPMFALVNGNNLSFSHMAGLLKLSMNSIPTTATKMEVETKAMYGLFNGYYKLNDGTYQVPVLEKVVEEGNQTTMTINLSTSEQNRLSNGAKSLFIPMAAGTYESLKVRFYNGEGGLLDSRSKTTSFTIERGGIYAMAEIDVKEATSVSDAEAFYKAITDGTADVKVTAAIALDRDIELSSTSKITFEKAPTISNSAKFKAAVEKNAAISSFTLVYPYGVAADDASVTNLDIDLSGCKVMLYSTDETEKTREEMDEKSMDYLNENVTADQFAISKVHASIAAKSIYMAANVCLDKMTIKSNVESFTTATGSFLLRVLIKSGASVGETDFSATDGEGCGLEDYWVDENQSNRMARSLDLVPSVNALVWDGISKKKPAQLANGEYIIKLAEELAWFMSVDPPTAAKAGDLAVTMQSSARLMKNIDLNNHPWVGGVIKNATFNGNNKTIYNLHIQQFVMDQQGTIYTPDACVGLFAAAYEGAKIVNLNLDGVTITCSTGSPKWVGSLVGYSYGASAYTNCKAQNVDINMTGATSYRVGGLIGYIEGFDKKNDPESVVLTGCEVNNATIAATFSYGGLVGSMYDSATFTNCKTSGITLNLNNAPWNYGYVSNFIGDIANAATSYSRTIKIKNCTATDLTAADKSRLGFNKVVGEQKSAYLNGTFMGNCPWCGLVEPVAGVLENGKFNIVVTTENAADKTLVRGVDFNVCQ